MTAFAYIPARGGSKRIPRKNIRALGGVPVLARVIAALREVGVAGVAVSTDDDEIAAIATAAGAVTLARRAPALAGDSAGFLELVRDDLPRYAEHFGTNDVLFALATAGLVPPQMYADALAVYERRRPALLLAATSFPISPFWALVPRDDGRGWRTLFPKEADLPSQQHPKTCVDAGLFYVLDLARTRMLKTLWDADPLEVYDVPCDIAIDVDDEADWHELELRYRARAE